MYGLCKVVEYVIKFELVHDVIMLVVLHRQSSFRSSVLVWEKVQAADIIISAVGENALACLYLSVSITIIFAGT